MSNNQQKPKYDANEIEQMALYLIEQNNRNAQPAEPPQPQGVQLSQQVRDMCAAASITEQDYIKQYNEIERQRGKPVTQFVIPAPPAAPVVDNKPLTAIEQEVARWSGMTDDEYRESRAKINQQRGK